MRKLIREGNIKPAPMFQLDKFIGPDGRPNEETRRMLKETIVEAEKIVHDDVLIDEVAFNRAQTNREANYARRVDPLVRQRDIKTEPIAIVGYGPSLLQTWPRLRQFKHIWSTSKAHDFLLQRGIRPERHLDLDPQPHKAEFLTKPQKDIEYLLSTHINPAYLDKLDAAGIRPKMFHVDISKGRDLRDPRYFGYKARFDIGAQAAEIAFRDGWRDQHWFGIEYGCPNKQSHAGVHWGPGSKAMQFRVSCAGKVYWTNLMFFHGLMLAETLLCDRALLKPTLHGDVLLYHFLKCRGRVPRVKCEV